MEDPTTGKQLARYHIWLIIEDYEFIKTTFGETPGTSAAIRTLLHKAVEQLKANAMRKAGAKPIADGNVEELI